MSDLQARLRKLDGREWRLWWTATSVMVGLLAVVLILTFSAVLHPTDSSLMSDLARDVHGLVALVLLFNLYAIYQQLHIKRLRLQMLEQVETIIILHGYAEKHKRDAVLDPLTGIYNRRMAEERLTSEMTRSQRHGYPLTIVAFDLDGFKPINDRHGHAAGDLVLKNFAERLRKITRGSDVAARTGGDEFLIILPECRPAQVERVLGRLKSLEIEFRGSKLPFGYSAGWAEYRPGDTLKELVERADQALYEDKRAHKGLR